MAAAVETTLPQDSNVDELDQNIPLAIVIVIASSLVLAVGAAIQHHAVGEQVEQNAQKSRMSFQDVWELVRDWHWLGGLVLSAVGAILNFVALTMAPVTLVQPLGVLAVPWSVLVAARIHRHKISKKMQASVALTVAGVIIFTTLTATHAPTEVRLDLFLIPIAAGIVYALVIFLGILGARGSLEWRCLFWASGGACLYGLESALFKSVAEFVKQNEWSNNPVFWGLAVALVVGFGISGWMAQQGYATGPAEIVVGSLTVTAPVVGVAFGIAVLGEGANITPITGFWMIVAGAMAVAGVLFLSKYHPTSEAAKIPDDVVVLPPKEPTIVG